MREEVERQRKAREGGPHSTEPEKLPQQTHMTIARVVRVEGEVALSRGGQNKPARAEEDLLPGDRLEAVGKNGMAALLYADGTRLEVTAGAVVLESGARGAKRASVEAGAVRAQVARQPKDQPMVFATPHGEATVLGTTLLIHVDPDPKKGTRLEVTEGKVRLKNLSGKTVDVPAGHYAVAAAGVDLAARALPVVLLGEDFARITPGSIPPGFEREGGTWRVQVLDGDQVLEGRGAGSLAFGDERWGNYELSVRVRLEAAMRLGLVVRHDPATQANHQIELWGDGIYERRSLREGQDEPGAKRSDFRYVPGRWHALAVSCRQRAIEFGIDGRRLPLSFEPLSARGHCKFFIRGDGAVYFDDLVVRRLAP